MLKTSLTQMIKNCWTIDAGLGSVMIVSGMVLMGCQTTPVTLQQGQKITAQTAVTPLEKPLLVKHIVDKSGLADVMWEFVSLNSKAPQVFINKPYLYLKALTGTITGSTGCNLIDGQFNVSPLNNVKLDAKAGHENCGEALAQEADIMDALSRARTYQIQDNMLYFYDQQGIILLTAKAKQG